jgi:nucleoside 2-deoxyribosyltransferase
MSRPLIYLAGPGVFRADAQEYGISLKRVCESVGLEGLWPLDASIGDVTVTPNTTAKQIYRGNINLIEQSDGVIADISPFRGPNMDPGTAFEIGFAIATDTPVFAWSDDLRALLDRTLRGAGDSCAVQHDRGEYRDMNMMLIEDFGLPENLMISCSVKGIYDCAAEAILAAAGILAGDVKQAARA